MEQHNYHSTITAPVSAEKAFESIATVNAWWAKDFKGRASQTGDKFTVQFGETKVDFEIHDVVPGKKITWLVTDCYLPWLKNKTEWTGTKLVWEISAKDHITQVDMTHVGLVPQIECYEACNKGWNEHMISLTELMTAGKGQPS